MGRRRQFIAGTASGLTLIEVLIGMLLAVVVVVTAISVRYYLARHAKRADIYSNAGRLGLLFLEGWRSASTPGAYDPVASLGGNMTIAPGAAGPAAPGSFVTLETYHVVVDNVDYYVTLAYLDATTSQPAILNVSVGWKRHFEPGDVSVDGECLSLTTYD